MTALDVQREDDVSSLAEVMRVDATIANVEAELAAARAALRADARVAARSLIAGETPTSDVRDAIARVGELEAEPARACIAKLDTATSGYLKSKANLAVASSTLSQWRNS